MGIFSKIFGDESLANLDSKIDTLMKSIPRSGDTTSSEDLTGKIIDSFLSQAKDDSDEDNIGKVLQNVVVPAERLARYGIYDEINKAIPIIRRIIKVYIANILPKNPVDGKCIIYREVLEDVDSEEVRAIQEKARNLSEQIVDEFSLTDKLKKVVLPRRLLYGDCFVEVVDVQKEIEKVDLNKLSGVITEQSIELLDAEIKKYNPSQGNGELLFRKIADMLVEVGPDSSICLEQEDDQNETDTEKTNKKDSKNQEFADILLKIHRPHNIVILDTQYGTRIGYLEVKQQDSMVHQNIGQSLAKTIGRITSMSGRDVTGEQSQEKTVNKLIYYVLKKIISKEIKPGASATDTETILKSLGEDVYLFIKRMFVEQGLNNRSKDLKQLKVRFIPPSRMVHFTNPSIDYGSYGESIVESLILPAKLYILSQLANAITKLSRASVVRKWTLETGSSQMHFM